MLFLTRRKAQKIFIGEEISIMVVERKGNSFVIGIDAPDDVEILREELTDGSNRSTTKERERIARLVSIANEERRENGPCEAQDS